MTIYAGRNLVVVSSFPSSPDSVRAENGVTTGRDKLFCVMRTAGLGLMEGRSKRAPSNLVDRGPAGLHCRGLVRTYALAHHGPACR